MMKIKFFTTKKKAELFSCGSQIIQAGWRKTADGKLTRGYWVCSDSDFGLTMGEHHLGYAYPTSYIGGRKGGFYIETQNTVEIFKDIQAAFHKIKFLKTKPRNRYSLDFQLSKNSDEE